MTKLNLSRAHFPVTALGPGKRVGIWFQGCSLRCPGCISADTWAVDRGRTTVESAIKVVSPWLGQADGVTISGGEPFEQPHALLALLGEIRTRFETDILVYTGYERTDIADVLKEADGMIDALITGRYRHDHAQTKPLRGSDNQILHLLTNLGRQRFSGFDDAEGLSVPVLDMMLDENGTFWFAGIPRRNDFERLRAVLADKGHQVAVSADNTLNRGRA